MIWTLEPAADRFEEVFDLALSTGPLQIVHDGKSVFVVSLKKYEPALAADDQPTSEHPFSAPSTNPPEPTDD